MTTIAEVLNEIERVAPIGYQESYDNSGLIYGDKQTNVNGVMLCLDVTEAVIDEALKQQCNLIVSHHPLIFSGIKKLTSGHYVDRCLIKAIKHDIALYACHTNLDNVLHNGVNQKIAHKLGLHNIRILNPKSATLCKIISYVPTEYTEPVLQALFASGAGCIGNYDQCSFSSSGTGTFRGNEQSNPFSGSPGELTREGEVKIEVVCETVKKHLAISALLKSHPYEEVAFDVIELQNQHHEIGSGAIGELINPVHAADFPEYIKKSMNAKVIKYTEFGGQTIKKVALCGGSGSFLIQHAKQAGADAYVTSDIKYHDFFEGDGSMMICDIGHYESEIFTLEIFHEIITKKFVNFAVRFTEANTNPVNYYSE